MVNVHFFEEADDALLQFVVFISKAYGIRKSLRRPKIFSGFLWKSGKKREYAPVPLTHQSFAHTESISTILAVKTRIIKIVPALVKKQVRHLPSIRFASR